MCVFCKGEKTPELKTRLCCAQSPSEAQRSICCLNTWHLRQNFLPNQISEGFFGELAVSTLGQLQQLSPGSSSSAHPQLQINLDSKKPREGAPCVRPCLRPKWISKQLWLCWPWRGVGGTWEGQRGRDPRLDPHVSSRRPSGAHQSIFRGNQ